METLYEKASLILNPGVYDTSKVYATKPFDGSGDLTFTRSNSTATRVGPNGLIEKVRTNLLTYSNTFTDASWIKLRVTFTGGQSDPFGGTNAWKMECSTIGSVQIAKNLSLGNGSIYAKAGNVSTFNVWVGLNVTFDLSTGTITTGAANGKIESVGGGWYRCTAINASGAIFNPNFTGSALGEHVFIAFAQAEASDIATDYIATTSAAVSVGPVANVPRLDYLNSSCPRLLLEPQRTNLVTYSEQFDNAAYTKVGGSVVANNSTSPDGYANADTFTADGANSSHRLFQTFSATSGTTYTASFFVKKGTADFVQIAVSSGTAFGFASFANFDISTGVVGTSGGLQTNNTITNYGNGWYRISSTITAIGTATAQVDLCIIQAANSVRLQSWTSSASVVLYGAQLEVGSYVSSYVNTLGAAVTRGADAASKTGISSLIGQTEGTIYFEGTFHNTQIGQVFMELTGSGSDVNFQISGNTLYFYSVSQWSISAAVSPNVRYKIAAAYKNNDIVLYINGVQQGTDTTASVTAKSNFYLNTRSLGDLHSDMRADQALLFKTRLSNSELALLTA